jgi:hypothetical protein
MKMLRYLQKPGKNHCMNKRQEFFLGLQTNKAKINILVQTREELVTTRVRFQVLMVVSMKITVFWDVAPYSLVKVY